MSKRGGRAKTTRATVGNHSSFSGERSLIAVVISVAVDDLQHSDRKTQRDAALYFLSDHYRSHLSLLGLPAEWLPTIWPADGRLASLANQQE